MITFKDYKSDIDFIVDLSLPWQQLKNSGILITGATGLIGSCMADVLIAVNKRFSLNMDIVLLVRSCERAKKRFADLQNEVTICVQDICEPIKVNGKMDYIVNCASNAHPKLYAQDPVGTIMTNVIGMSNILEYALKHNTKRVLELSSVEIYGENRGDVNAFSEDYCGVLNCGTYRGGYPESKRVCETLCHSYIQKYGMDCVIARLSRCYGPTMNMNDSKASAQFIKSALCREDIVIKSSGMQRFSYLYMADAVSGLLTILLKGISGEAYNVSDSKSDVTLREFAIAAAETAGTRVEFRVDEQIQGYSGAVMAVMNSEKLKALGWSSRFDVKTGVKRTIDVLMSIQNSATFSE